MSKQTSNKEIKWSNSKDYKPLISIIIPVYNVEKYINKCVDSVINQIYSNLEIILVDDGSPDLCGKLCDEYSKTDSRIKVIHKKNGGLSDARNVGIDIASGSYIAFIDSDDWVRDDYINSLYEALIKTKSDVSVCEFSYITEDNKMLNSVTDDNHYEIFSNAEALVALMHTNKIYTSAWGKLYKKELFTTRRYPKGKLFEDIPVTYDIFLQDIKVVFVANASYNYLYRESAISKMKFSPERMDSIYFIEDAMQKVVSKRPKLSGDAKVVLFRVYFSVWQTFYNKKEYKKYYYSIKKNLNRYRWDVIKSKRCNIKLKIKALLTFLPLNFSQMIMNIHL